MSKRIAFVFPGQGSQSVGMGADIFAASPAARAVYETADAALGFSLSTLCFEGPEETLRETSQHAASHRRHEPGVAGCAAGSGARRG